MQHSEKKNLKTMKDTNEVAQWEMKIIQNGSSWMTLKLKDRVLRKESSSELMDIWGNVNNRLFCSPTKQSGRSSKVENKFYTGRQPDEKYNLSCISLLCVCVSLVYII